MNEDNKPPTELSSASVPDALAGGSVILPVIGFVFFAFGLLQTINHADGGYGGGAVVGFLIWLPFALAGLVCALISISRRGWSRRSQLGLALCAAPLLILLYIFAINSR